MKVYLNFILYALMLFLLLYIIEGDAEYALHSAIIIPGEVFVIYSFIGVYQYLKSLKFRFRYVHRNYWISWALELGTIVLLFYFLLPYPLIVAVCIITPMLLVFLLIYDLISSFFRK